MRLTLQYICFGKLQGRYQGRYGHPTLHLLPSSLTKNEISSLFLDITMYMIEREKNLAQEKGVYTEPEAYTGHPIDERTEKIVMEYYINEDFNCSIQSPNKNDVITVKINDKKEKKVK